MGVYSDIYITFTAEKENIEKIKSTPNEKVSDNCESGANIPEPQCTFETNSQSQSSSE